LQCKAARRSKRRSRRRLRPSASGPPCSQCRGSRQERQAVRRKSNAQRRTGVAYSDAFLRHDTGPRHPERAERLRAIVGRLKEARVWERLEVWEPSPCDEATLELIHTPAHVAAMRQLTAAGGGHIDADTVVSADSWEAALRAAGGLVEAVQRV